MNKGRSTTLKERIEITNWVIAHDYDYSGAMRKFTVSYGQVYSWTKKLKKYGPDGLIDRRGKGKSENDLLTTAEKQALEVKRLKEQVTYLSTENNLLKKITGDRKKGFQENKYRAIKELSQKVDERSGKVFSVALSCQIMQVARSSYYAWLNHVPSKRNIDDQGILDYVIQLEEAHNYIFGVKRLVMHVNDDTQYHVSNSKMRRIMRENNI
ncbi:helix-turn-helix domain-containing protein, partial [Amylolactobacillus amylophilus]|uniref:helix-turn-helix domain-containing protein n=1 Tax=Amylolactobacillus amylophilus TaxID=1603 RepID=UPI0020926C1D